jgi:peptide/nickel transport system substrate-binding protein
MVQGSTRESFGLSMNVYDWLFSFGRKKLGANWVFDPTVIRGELAKGYQVSPDGMTVTIALRPDTTWHDGSPVTAEDIKWSLDRAVSAKSHAAADDPWVLDWLKSNSAAGGAYIVESFKPGESVIIRHNETWKGGALPFFHHIIIQTVPEPATRANLIEKGDADLAIDLAASDIPTMEKSAKAKMVSLPLANGLPIFP